MSFFSAYPLHCHEPLKECCILLGVNQDSSWIQVQKPRRDIDWHMTLAYAIPSSVVRHGGSHANGVWHNGNLHAAYVIFKWSLVHDHYFF